MPTPIIATKLYIPPPRPQLVIRPRLIEKLNEGLLQNGGFARKLTLVSAPAGFGKTTVVSEWCAAQKTQIAWLSLDEADSDPTRFLVYLVAALQTIAPKLGQGVLAVLQSPLPPPPEALLTILLNEISTLPDPLVLVLDDYHLIDAKPIDVFAGGENSSFGFAKTVDDVVTFLLEHLPPRMHLVIATREDPHLPLARLRARRQLNELRAADLRFTPSEAAEFLNQVMGLNLSAEDVTALETRTEGWIAGLQLAALSMQGQQDTAGFIQSFTGSHHFVLDYLVEEVLQQQPERIQTFLLCTSILDRLCGPLCDAVLLASVGSGQETLEYLQRANLFLVPLDNERRWYRYHHLFADLLRQRLQPQGALHQSAASFSGAEGKGVAKYHVRASIWYEENGMEVEAFQHAVAANDVERAARLMEGGGMPLQFRGAMTPVLNWLGSLPPSVLDARPSLWVAHASVLTIVGKQINSVEPKLQAAEAAVQSTAVQGSEDVNSKDLIGHIAAIRAMLAVSRHDADTIISESRRALEYLSPDNLPLRTNTAWTLGFAYQLQGDRPAASRAFTEAISVSEASGNIMVTIAATTLLGQVQETDTQLHLASESYRRVLQLAGDPPLPAACEAYLGLARLSYEWNDLDAAEELAQQCLELARQMENVDTPASVQVLLSRIKLASGDAAGAAALLAQASQFVRRHNFVHRMPEVAAVQVLGLIHQGNLAAAAQLAQTQDLPISRAQVHLAKREPTEALAVLEPLRKQAEAKGWEDERLKVMMLQALAHHAQGDKDKAVRLLEEALTLSEPGGYIRIFVDKGPPMAALLQEVAKHGSALNYVRQLRAAFGKTEGRPPVPQPLVDPLSERELEVLGLLATDFTGPEIARKLTVSLNTMRTHTKNIYNKLGVNSRRLAVHRAKELDLI